MRVEDLRDSVNEIHMKDERKREMVRYIKEHMADRREAPLTNTIRHRPSWSKRLTAAAAVVAAVLVMAVPVRALVASLVQERMEKMPEEERTEFVEQVKEQQTEAGSYSRAYTEAEKARYAALAEQYRKGVFPEGSLVQVQDDQEASEYELCFISSTGTFSLPERELTDEELLEIIDFILKREYAYTQYYEEEHRQEIEQEKKQEREKIADNIESGGITRETAVETATAALHEIYGVTGEGMDFNCYYSEGEEGGRFKEACYSVNWTDIIVHKYYYFMVSARDGRIVWMSMSSADAVDLDLGIEQAREMIPELQKQAVRFVEDTLGETYEDVYVSYLERDNGTAHRSVGFYFQREDGGARCVKYYWDGTFEGYEERSLPDVRDGDEREMFMGGKKEMMHVVFKKLEL